MTEPLRKAAELESRVTRAVDAADAKPSRDQAMIRWLAERLAIALALEIKGETVADAHSQDQLADLYRDAQEFVLGESATWTARREALKSDVEFERATIRIKVALSQHLRAGTT